MKRLFMLLLLTSSLFAGVSSSRASSVSPIGDGQTETVATSDQPFYLYQGKRIPLQVREDAVAVAFKPKVSTRGENRPQYLQLQDALKASTRSAAVTTQISPLGQQYAIASLPTGTRSTTNALESRITQQSFVETTLPIFRSPGQSETIVLNDELIVSFDPALSRADQDRLLAEQGAEILRPILLSRSRFVVRTPQTQGLGALEIANTLAAVPGVQSVSPNFVQQVTRSPQPNVNRSDADSRFQDDLRLEANQAGTRGVGQNSLLLPWQWHISSLPMLSCLGQQPDNFSVLADCMKPGSHTHAKLTGNLQRTDLRIPEVWQQGQQGKGAIVAVIDSLIQWDHPALRDSLHQVSQGCDGEVYGWDFSDLDSNQSGSSLCDLGDAETRMEQDEFAFLQWHLEQAFTFTDEELLEQYSVRVTSIREQNPNVPLARIANALREEIKQEISSEFHGTSVSSVVAANTSAAFGMVGVAPEAKILPVRVMGLNGSFSLESYLNGILYAAERGADVINISLGGAPTDDEADTIAQVLAENPGLVIVAASGNKDSDQPEYPAAFPGVLSVGATNVSGQRAPYSSFGSTVDMVAPGGDTSDLNFGGMLVAGGTWMPELWQGIPEDQAISDRALDPRGTYFFTQGTSFAAPAVAGVVALMKGEDPQRRLTSSQITTVLKSTANNDVVSLTDDELSLYREISQSKAANVEAEAKTYFLGEGLVNAEAAVQVVRQTFVERTR